MKKLLCAIVLLIVLAIYVPCFILTFGMMKSDLDEFINELVTAIAP